MPEIRGCNREAAVDRRRSVRAAQALPPRAHRRCGPRAWARPYSSVAQKAAAIGLVKTPEYLSSPAAHRLDGLKGEGTRFLPGQAAWNKGVRGIVGVQEACRATQFKPGQRPHTWVPIGTTRIVDGQLQRKLNDLPGPNNVRWFPVSRLVWEAANGPVPAGHLVVFKTGRATTVEANITLDAVECISRRDLMLRNTYHRYGPDVAKLVQLRGAITRQINKRAKEHAE